MPFVDRISPPLTTVRIQHAEMGRQAADVLLAELGGAPQPARDIMLEPLLVVRDSAGPPPARVT
jgi:LacI family transcriptional regulator